jgi:hypothetical protein
MAKNFSGKDRIELCAKSLISLVYDLLARHNPLADMKSAVSRCHFFHIDRNLAEPC